MKAAAAAVAMPRVSAVVAADATGRSAMSGLHTSAATGQPCDT
jgi:hypothetical protein